jgi:cysteine desulfurase/selenocysteine lyase
MNSVQQAMTSFDVLARRAEFPILQREVHGKPLVYLDNAATAQRPQCVIDAVNNYYCTHNANVHRGVHTLSNESTDLYEGARETIRAHINAASTREIIFTRGTTESINLVAQSFGRSQIKAGDQILVSHMEHHSNIVPWQLLCEQTGAELVAIPITEQGDLDLAALDELLNERVKILALVHISNALGTINPVAEIIAKAKALGITTLLDGAQALPHLNVDVRALGCDFYCLSGHKMYGPTGIGVLYGREALLEAMPPWQGGGEMIAEVSFEHTIYSELPAKFEAGTPNMAGAVGLGEAARYLQRVGLEHIAAHEHELLQYATEQLSAVKGLRIIGQAQQKASVISFVVDGTHPHDLGTLIDLEGVAVRTGHHCAMPVTRFFQVPATARASFALYNTFDDVDRLVAAVQKSRDMLL